MTKTINTWAVDGVDDDTGEHKTYYTRNVGGLTVWISTPPEQGEGFKEFPEDIKNIEWFTPTCQPYRVQIEIIPKRIAITKLT